MHEADDRREVSEGPRPRDLIRVEPPLEHRGRVRERFVRLDAARSAPGGGLGLAIVAACAKLHGGSLDLLDADPGLRVVIDLADHR